MSLTTSRGASPSKQGYTRGYPEIAQILQRQNISGREYLLTQRVAMATEMMDEALRDEVLRREFEKSVIPMMTDALKFWMAMDPALKAEAAEWKKMREEMGKYLLGR